MIWGALNSFLWKLYFSGLITTIKNVCVKASHFVKSPKTVSLTLYLSALNTEVAKTAQAACFFVFFFFLILFCISQTIMSYALLLYTVHWNSFKSYFRVICALVIQSSKMEYSSIKYYYYKNLIKISFEFKFNKTVSLYILSITALYTQSYEVFTCFSYHTGY